MPVAATEYHALAGKTRAMVGKLITSEQYRDLIRQKSIQDVVAYLKMNTPYRDALAGLNERDFHRVPFENALRKSLMEDYRKVFCFSNGAVKEFLKVVYLRHEVESVKRLFRVLEMEKTTTLVEDSLFFLKKYNTLNLAQLTKSRTSQEFIANLQGTIYYSVLRPFLSDDKSHNLFHIEMTLDMYYMNLVLAKKKKLLQGLDASVVERAIGTEVDVLNLLWIFRGRMIYNLDRSLILSYLIPHGYKITRELAYELADTRDEAAFRQLVSRTKYAELFLPGKHNFFELNFHESMFRMHRSFLRKYGFSIAGALACLHLKEYEISNIISILEGIRYHLPAEAIAEYIIGYQAS